MEPIEFCINRNCINYYNNSVQHIIYRLCMLKRRIWRWSVYQSVMATTQNAQLAGNAKSGHFSTFSNGTPCIYYVHSSYVYEKGKKGKKIFLDMLGSEPAATSITNFGEFSVLYSGLKSPKKSTCIKGHPYILVLPFYLSIFVRTKHLYRKNLV